MAQYSRIKLLSVGSMNNTVIDGKNISTVIWINSSVNIDSNTIINGFTIQHGGNVDYGGGIYSSNASLIISNCSICYNSSLFGAGLYMAEDSSKFVTVSNCLIHNNIAQNSGGGLLFLSGSYKGKLKLYNTVITDNTCNSLGAGLFNWARAFVGLINSVIVNNHGRSAVEMWDGTLKGGLIAYNSSSIRASNCMLANLTLLDNDEGIVTTVQAGFNPVVLSYSNIIQSGTAYTNELNSKIDDASNNWWGDVSGPNQPSQNPNGQGAKVGSFIKILPFLTIPSDSAPLIPIQNVHALNNSGNNFILTWSPSLNAHIKGYKIFYTSDTSSYHYTDSIDIGLDTSYILTGLKPDINYKLVVTCYDSLGFESWYSRKIKIQTFNPKLSLLNNSPNFLNTRVRDTTDYTFHFVSDHGIPITIDSLYTHSSIFKIRENYFTTKHFKNRYFECQSFLHT